MRLFGTDGIRAPFGQYPLDRPTVTLLGLRLAEFSARRDDGSLVILGGDTRDSTPVICRWLAAGLHAGGATPRFAGTVPTPAISALVRHLGAAAGVAVSASHNPHPDNGIKLFDAEGFKWAPAAEQQLEEMLATSTSPPPEIERLDPDPELASAYLRWLEGVLGREASLEGLRLVVDSAHGAAFRLAPALFERLGAEVVPLGDRPDGRNINAGVGSTSPAAMAAAIGQSGAHLGFAFDGDADRVILADETGTVRDGDAMLFAWACDLQRAGRLEPARIVATSMSNLGLEHALANEGIGVKRCDVGDRVVVSTMRGEGIRLGGEQSGHLVHLDLSTTGDGLVTALQMASLVRRRGEPFSSLTAKFQRFPQILRNVRVSSKPDLRSLPDVMATAAQVENRLGNAGRLVLRYSGTEPLARVMIEGRDPALIETLAEKLITAIREAVGER